MCVHSEILMENCSFLFLFHSSGSFGATWSCRGMVGVVVGVVVVGGTVAESRSGSGSMLRSRHSCMRSPL